MSLKKIGLITYDYPHLKTEQVFHNLFLQNLNVDFVFYTLPFKSRPKREVLFQHRPDQFKALPPSVLAEKHNIPLIRCKSDVEIDNSCDIYLLLGGGNFKFGMCQREEDIKLPSWYNPSMQRIRCVQMGYL